MMNAAEPSQGASPLPARPGKQVDWVARGREHQWQSRPIHALFCFTRAIAERPARANARFHLGEVLWQLGLTGAAKGWALPEALPAEPSELVPPSGALPGARGWVGSSRLPKKGP